MVYLYIPLCLYFNERVLADSVAFVQLYIPLCLYFNEICELRHIDMKPLYIPLCLYFNQIDQWLYGSPYFFTFHYVSILISFGINAATGNRTLHSIMSLF